MQRLRRSFRESFRRKRDKVSSKNSNNGNHNSTNGLHQWHSDDIGVRQGNCIFPIKYLGCVEVFESRGMPICEEALKVLRSTKRKSIRGTLFVTGDGLRVVDGETRGLIVDQTIEKVSFCSPDRNNDRGFAYICRDGTTRRWMCHGFHAIDNSGERLSHAVGCAFAICLERKQKRDREAAELAATAAAATTFINQNQNQNNFMTTSQQQQLQNNRINQLNHSNNISSASSIHNRQSFKISEPPPMKPIINPYAIDRPHATPLMLQRQTSFRPLSNLRSQSPFKRQLSLKLIGHQPNLQNNNPIITSNNFTSNNDRQQNDLMTTKDQQPLDQVKILSDC